MVLLVLKVLLAPVLLAACSFAAWRWGSAVGGWLLGLPLVSGPVSFLLFLEHGPRFAEAAARGTLLGFLATGAFCVWYAALAHRTRWWLTLPLAYAVCLSVAGALSLLELPVAWVAAGTVGILAVLALVIRPVPDREPAPAPAPATLAVKMATVSLIVVAITGLAGALGPQLAGLLAPLPVLLSFMTASAHRRSGHLVVRDMMRGALAGCWGGAAFFAVLALELGPASPGRTYIAAVVAGLAGAALAMALQRAEEPDAVAVRRRAVHRTAIRMRWAVRRGSRALRLSPLVQHLTPRG